MTAGLPNSPSSDAARTGSKDCWNPHQTWQPNDSATAGRRRRRGRQKNRCFWLRVWGIHADEPALRTVLQHLWSESDPKTIANLLRVFARRQLPEFDPRLIDLCRHGDEEVRRWAFAALQKNAHPLIRQFALTELENGVRDESVVALFINHYQRGDEHRLLEALELPEDECELHWLLMDAIKVLKENPEADCSRLGVIAYASTPCETCRFEAARLLFNQQAAPQWLKEECRHDSCEDCRELAAKVTGPKGAS